MKTYKDFFLYLKGGHTFISRDGFSVTADEDSWFFGDASAYVLVTVSTGDVYLEMYDAEHGRMGQYRRNDCGGELSTEDILDFLYDCRRDLADRYVSLCEDNWNADQNIKFWRACNYLIALLNFTDK